MAIDTPFLIAFFRRRAPNNTTYDQVRLADVAEKLKAENAELRRIIMDAIPFIGYSAHVPDLIERAEKAVDYAKEQN